MASRDGRQPRPQNGSGLASRGYALELIARVLDDRLFFDDARERLAERRARLEPRDQGFAHALVLAMLRGLGRIDAEIDARLSRPLPERAGRIRHVLRLAAAEILYLDTPLYAAVDAAVELAKRADMRLAGLVNAVTRRIGEAAEEIRAAPPVAPAWFEEALVRDWGEERAKAILTAHRSRAPLDLTLRSAADREKGVKKLGAELLPTGSLRLAHTGSITELPGYEEGAWWVQDAAAALPARALLAGVDAPDGLRALDLCAAPGGKTLQLASAGLNVTALDVSEWRVKRLEDNLERTRLQAEIVCADALTWRPAAPFDLILLDAPCSATGTVRRHPELPWIKTEAGLGDLARLQDALLDAAWEMLAPGGRLAFCTCSLLRVEGEERAEAFLARQASAAPDPIEAAALGAPEAAGDKGRLRLTPELWGDRGGLDGFFIAVFRKAT